MSAVRNTLKYFVYLLVKNKETFTRLCYKTVLLDSKVVTFIKIGFLKSSNVRPFTIIIALETIP